MELPPGVRRDRWPGPDRQAEVAAELEFHLQSRIDELTARGVPADQARERALREFGPVAPIAADCGKVQRHREVQVSRLSFVRGLVLELKATVRGLIRAPGFAAVAIATLGLGIGATTAVFTIFDGVLLKRLPYGNLDRLARLWENDQRGGRINGQLTIADLRDYADQSRRFDGFAAFRWRSATLAPAGEDAVQLVAAEVMAPFFDLLGIRPALGRTFAAGEDRDARGQLVVLSHRLWRDRFGADSALIGSQARISDAERTVIGVLPDGFVNPVGQPVDVWFANDFEAIADDAARARRMHFLSGIARLAPGVTVEQGRAELETIAAGIATRFPDLNEGHVPHLLPLQEAGVTPVRPMLILVLAAVGCLLLITCANLANLVFARALARSREFAVRSALGAGRLRIVRQVMIEQLLLATAGAALGLVVATLTVGVGVRGLGQLIPRLDRVAVDPRAFAAAAVLSVVAALLSGLVPALIAVRTRGDSSLTSRSGLSRTAARGRDLLVAVQTGLAALLLVSAGLAARSISRLLGEDVGFVTGSVWTFQAPLSPARYQDAPSVDRFRIGLLERIRDLPGVRSASVSYALPMENTSTTSLVVEGEPPPVGPPPTVGYNSADGDYFRTLGIPLLEGRTFTPHDDIDAPPVVVVNQTLARRFFPGRSPVGARVRAGPDPASPSLEIVGVVGDIRREQRSIGPAPEIYYSMSQDGTRQPSYSVKVDGDAAPVLARIKATIRELDAQVPMGAVASLDQVVGRTVERPRAVAFVLLGFGALALLVAAVGVYGVIAFLVAERQREIAVRLAIGASAGRVLLETTRRGLTPTLLGLAGGIGAALLLGSVLSRFLYEVAATDVLTYLTVIGTVAVTAAVGALIPGIRAARVAPALVLRD